MIKELEGIKYDLSKHVYYFEPMEYKKRTGYDIKGSLGFIEDDTDADLYIKRCAFDVLNYLISLGPKRATSKNGQRRYVIEYLICEDNNNEVEDFLNLLEEYITTDIEGQSVGIQRQSHMSGSILSAAEKRTIRFSVQFRELLDSSILGKTRLAVFVPQEVLDTRGVDY